MPLRELTDLSSLPALKPEFAMRRPVEGLPDPLGHPPRILLLYGSLRERSFSRLAVEEAARLLTLLGAETRIFDPSDLPLPDQVKGDDHPAVRNCASTRSGRKVKFGAAPNATGRSPA